jgi:hypothetical protein
MTDGKPTRMCKSEDPSATTNCNRSDMEHVIPSLTGRTLTADEFKIKNWSETAFAGLLCPVLEGVWLARLAGRGKGGSKSQGSRFGARGVSRGRDFAVDRRALAPRPADAIFCADAALTAAAAHLMVFVLRYPLSLPGWMPDLATRLYTSLRLAIRHLRCVF